jgi:hypothetical protein
MTAIATTAGGHKLGKHAPKPIPIRHRMAARQLMATLPPAPATRDWTKAMTFPAGVMGNDALSDCTAAAVGHIVQAWSANNGSQITIPDAAIIKFYSDSTGYIPGDASTDQGGVEAEVLACAKTNGCGGYKIDGFAPADSSNLAELRQVVNTFGGAYIGLALPRTIETQGEYDGATWDVDLSAGTAAEPGSLGGHAVVIEAYDANGFTIVTWGVRVYMTNSFMLGYGHPAVGGEAWAMLANGLWAPKGTTPAGDAVPAYDGYLAAVA